MKVLICSQQGEYQVDEVCAALKKQGIEPVLFERYRKDHFISYHYGKSIVANLHIGEQEYALTSNTFPSVWYRLKPVILGEIPSGMMRIDERFCFQEWRVLLHSLNQLLAASKWINPIDATYQVGNKALQLKYAMEAGLKVPKTVITNQAEKILCLFENNSRVIYKTLSSFFTADFVIFTNEITQKQIMANKQSISMAPGIYQQLIEKKHELRVTVVGDKIFVIKIKSQLIPDGIVDWRKHHHPDLYEIGEITEETRNKILLFHKKMNLVYAAYDFIFSKDNEEIFLECNPSGQWLWLENYTDLNISQTMVKELTT